MRSVACKIGILLDHPRMHWAHSVLGACVLTAVVIDRVQLVVWKKFIYTLFIVCILLRVISELGCSNKGICHKQHNNQKVFSGMHQNHDNDNEEEDGLTKALNSDIFMIIMGLLLFAIVILFSQSHGP